MLRPYDGRTLAYSHADTDPEEGLQLVARFLALPQVPTAASVRYAISLYSGGIGILDTVAITLAAGAATAHGIAARLQLVTPDAAAQDPAWEEDFRWLVDHEPPLPVRDASARFLDDKRRPFQPACRPTDPQWFASGSGVNSWSALWEHDGAVSFLALDQG